MVSYHDGVAILQVIAFSLSLLVGISLCIKHGFSRGSGFLILITFSILRILGGSFTLAAESNPSKSVVGGALVCQALGLAPLVIINLSLLGRLNSFVARPIDKRLWALISIASIAGISVGIYGGTSSTKAASQDGNVDALFRGNSFSEAAVVIFAAIFAAACLLFVLLVRQRSSIPASGEGRRERVVLWCFVGCAPLVTVRLVYSLVGAFAHEREWNPYFGSPTLFLCMAVLEEILAVAIVAATGFALRPLPKGGKGANAQTPAQDNILLSDKV